MVTFNMTNVGPPSMTYVPVDEGLLVNIWNSLAALTVVVRIRLLRADGTISRTEQAIAPAAGFNLTSSGIPLAEGFILGVEVLASGALPQRGQCFVDVGLGPIGANNVVRGFQRLFSDYLQGGVALSFPGSRILSTIEGPGATRSITGTVPGAGGDIQETVPPNAQWRLLFLRGSLTAGAAVANREPRLIFDDGANIFFVSDAIANQLAGSTVAYSMMRGSAPSTTVSGDTLIAVPDGIMLKAGWRIRTSTTGIQGADQWTAPQYVVEEWVAPA